MIVKFHPFEYGKLILCLASNLEDLDSAFLRASIYYEHPTLRNTVVTEIPKTAKYSGHNMPFKVLLEFMQKAKRTEGENNLYKQLLRIGAIEKANFSDIYIIASISNDSSTLQHEEQHAKYYFNLDYRNLVHEEYTKIPHGIKMMVSEYFKSCGYREDVWEDEFQAHLVCNQQMITNMSCFEEIKNKLIKFDV